MSTGDQGAAASETAPAAVAVETGRFRRPYSILLQAGSAAAAIASIFGLVVIFVPGLNLNSPRVEKVSTVLPNGDQIKLAVEQDVERMTYGRFLELETGSREGVTPNEVKVPGVDVRYVAEYPGYAKGAPFRARFTLEDQSKVTKHRHIRRGRLDADRDSCRCAEFVPVPVGPASYRVIVELYRPGAPYAAPVLPGKTDWFTAATPPTDG